MALEAGTKLGAYEILAPLGAGGMGEVYRARDSKLDRTVAIKVLPDALAQDGERIARFQREARLLASLNHPKIAAIHGFENADGKQFLVLEYVQGETLADRLKRGPLAVPEALTIGQQIADALESAHSRGVIHRDLKPGNVMITPDGAAKVLDFGLARAMSDDPGPPSSVTSSPTITAHYTRAGTILGTAAYMSPEQARGRPLDKRTDVWSFGCVLYEGLGGCRPFEGETTTDMIARILEREPDWNGLPPDTPPAIQKLLRRCLQKDRKDRLRDLGDALLELNEAIEKRSWLVTSEQTAQPRPAVGRGRMIVLAAVMLSLGLAAGLAVSRLGPSRSGGPVIRASVKAPPNARFIPLGNFEGYAVISPDGRMLAFSARGQEGGDRIWVRALDALSARALPGTEGGRNVFWSQDSRSLGFFADGKLKRVEVAGGAPLTLCDAPNGRGGTWNQNGVILFTPDFRTPVYRVQASGGKPTAVTTLDESKHTTNRWPYFLPDGHHFLYTGASHDPSRARYNALYFAALDGAEQHVIMHSNTRAVFASGFLLFMRDTTLVAQRFDERTGTVLGEPVTIADTVLSDPGSWFAAFSASETGILAYHGGTRYGSQLAWLDRATQKVTPIGHDRDLYFGPRISPDGTRLAVTRGNPGDIWIYELDRGLGTRFTVGLNYGATPIWSPDGARLVYCSSFNPDGHNRMYEKPADGTGGEEVLLEDDELMYSLDWSPDGRFILFWKGTSRPFGAYWILPLDGVRKPFLFLESPFAGGGARFSPDGRWIAYTSNISGNNEVYVAPFNRPDDAEEPTEPTIGGQQRISADGGSQPIWGRDGSELFYVSPDNRLFAVEIHSSDGTLEVGATHPLFTMEISDAPFSARYDVFPDGTRFAVNSTEGESSPITLVINWPAELATQ